MNMHDYLRICRRRWATILLTLIVAVIAAAATYPFQPITYASTTKVFVSASSGTDLVQLQQGSSFAEQRAATYADLVDTPAVLGPVVRSLSLESSAAQLAEDVEAEGLPETTLLEITATAGSAQQAADVADAVVTSLQDVVDEIETSVEGTPVGDPGIMDLAVVQAAEVPVQPQSPRLDVTLGAGLVIGLILGVGLAFLRETLDTTIRRPEDFAPLTVAPLLGVTRREGGGREARRRKGRGTADSAAAFREMRMRLRFGESFSSPSSYVITSSVEGEGRTTVAVNLARSLAEGGRKTLLIGADFENPDLAEWLDMGDQSGEAGGLRDVLGGRVYLEDVIISGVEEGLDVILPGALEDQSMEPSSVDQVQVLLEACAENYDVTIIDTPALLSVSDAALLAQITTGVIVVTRYGTATRAQLATSFELLARARARVVGLVLAGVPMRGPDSLQERRQRPSRRSRGELEPGGVPPISAAERSHAGPRRLSETDASASVDSRRDRVVALPQDRG
ncbi:polysaccharide biosynthesis tyrosine autokinase [Nesterenkonia lutea]|uniref:Capsular exopolysaccharide synthesis family protein n=1 Tax=Nesterenkonia lutea TaxID=272919 RepID=A0ABR9JCV0_9MICC|nr:polysaccharide biosynthesis tyrosine autokinase [Nesterenkonia lutea]MBE1523761.1 capsular exopolysaccharide synthesis family protein [Nesterenkonia lutea]